jgi:hypothetical protein
MSIKDGAIIDMQVITDDDRTFTNFFAPLSINLFNEKGYSLTYLNRQGHIDRLFVNRFIRWEREHGFSPKDEAIVLDADNTEASLERGVGINHVIDLSLFTDLPGLFGDKPNGITQIEAFTKVITNTTPLSYRNKSKPYKKLIPWIPIKFVTLRANYARFDEKFSTTVLDETFSRQVLLQRSHLNFDLTVNLFSRWLLKKSPHWFNVNTGGGVFSSNLATGEDTVNVLLPYFFFEPTFELKTVQNFGIDFSFRFLRQQAPQLEEHDGWRWIFRPQATLYWSSPDNASSKIFARAIFFNDLKDQENPFFQFQIGYAIRLSQFIGARGKIEDIKDEEN